MNNEKKENKTTNTSSAKTTTINSPSGVSVSTKGKDDVDREFYFSQGTPNEKIIASTTLDLGIELEPQEKNKFIESLNVLKTYVSEFEVGLSFKGFNFKIKREPKIKIIKAFIK